MLLRRFCRYMSNRPVRSKATCGLRVTGVMAPVIIIGFQAAGLLRPQWAYFGPRPGGAGTTARTYLMGVTGARLSVFTEALTTVMATPGTATGADDGKEMRFVTTPL